MIELTRLDGSLLWLGHGFTVREADDGHERVPKGARTMVIYGGVTHYVTEEPGEVVAQIESGELR